MDIVLVNTVKYCKYPAVAGFPLNLGVTIFIHFLRYSPFPDINYHTHTSGTQNRIELTPNGYIEPIPKYHAMTHIPELGRARQVDVSSCGPILAQFWHIGYYEIFSKPFNPV